MIEVFQLDMNSPLSTASLLASVSAGSPVNISNELKRIDLNELLAGKDDKCLLLRITGDSMVDCGIADGDMVILSRERLPQNNDIVIAEYKGGFVIKRFQHSRNGLKLVPANPDYQPTDVTEADDFSVIGVVVYLIRRP